MVSARVQVRRLVPRLFQGVEGECKVLLEISPALQFVWIKEI